jgi:CRISPR-associated endonuclease/helicase Cas3
VETVRDAAAIYTRLKDSMASQIDCSDRFLFLYHGRIADQDRPKLYQDIKKRDGENQPYILVTTSAIEVGCDLNSETLITQICPPENLIQRAGRCNRRGDILDAKVVIVGDTIPEFANSLNEEGWQKYKTTLEKLSDFDTNAISECIYRDQQIDDYRVIELFSMLHDYVYKADLTCQPSHEKGLVVTRSWVPSATLVYDDGTHDKIEKMPQITIPIDRLIKKHENSYANTHVYERYYSKEETRWKQKELGWGCAYQKDILVTINKTDENACIFDLKQEYNYNPELGFVDLPGIFIKLKPDGFEEKLFYQHDDRNHKAIITYNKSLARDEN